MEKQLSFFCYQYAGKKCLETAFFCGFKTTQNSFFKMASMAWFQKHQVCHGFETFICGGFKLFVQLFLDRNHKVEGTTLKFAYADQIPNRSWKQVEQKN